MNSKKVKIALLSLIIVAIIFVIGGTYAYLMENATSRLTERVNTVSNVEVTLTENTDYMKSTLYPTLEVDATSLAYFDNENGICMDSSSYNKCSLYQFTVTNESEVLQKLNYTLNIMGNDFKNLYYKVFKSTSSSISSISEVVVEKTYLEQYQTGSFSIEGLTTTLGVNNSETESETYTIMFWIEYQSGYDQTAVDAGKDFSASITLNSISTGNLAN